MFEFKNLPRSEDRSKWSDLRRRRRRKSIKKLERGIFLIISIFVARKGKEKFV